MGFFEIISLIKTIIDLLIAGTHASREAVYRSKKKKIKEDFCEIKEANERERRLDALKRINDRFNSSFH